MSVKSPEQIFREVLQNIDKNAGKPVTKETPCPNCATPLGVELLPASEGYLVSCSVFCPHCKALVGLPDLTVLGTVD